MKVMRKIIKIDEELCDGCGQCVPSCAEGAIEVLDGKARLVAEKYCDGLGACMGDCPNGALKIVEREADDFDEEAVEEYLSQKAEEPEPMPMACGCPSTQIQTFIPASPAKEAQNKTASALSHWPVQMHLISPRAPQFKGADLVLAADCVAYAMGDFHESYLKGKALAIACPKLDEGQEIYLEKLKALIDEAEINTLTVMIMQVPCCRGLMALAEKALEAASRKIPLKRVVVSIQGEILEEAWV